LFFIDGRVRWEGVAHVSVRKRKWVVPPFFLSVKLAQIFEEYYYFSGTAPTQHPKYGFDTTRPTSFIKNQTYA
jgi:hypothetical protein